MFADGFIDEWFQLIVWASFELAIGCLRFVPSFFCEYLNNLREPGSTSHNFGVSEPVRKAPEGFPGEIG